MARYSLTLVLTVCCVISISSMANAQTSGNKPSPEDKKKQAAAKWLPRTESDNSSEARQAFAIQVVSTLADEARSYKDESLRSSIQARAADVLWQADRERARALFNRAWEAAEAVDREGRRRSAEEQRRFLSGEGGTGFIPLPPNLRAEVLRLTSRRDQALAESFLAKMEEADKRDEEESNTTKDWNPTQPPEATAKRLELARQLLESGEIEKALVFAGPGLNRVTSQGIMFLVLLRKTNAALGDQRFTSMLERTATDPMADATSVSLLSSYVFTPSLLVTVTRSGLLMNPWRETLYPPDLTPALRTLFFRVTTQILLRQVPPSELDRTSAGRAGTYFTIMRLLPLVKQHDPDMAAALQGRLNTLAQVTDGVIPEQQRAFVNAGFNSEQTEEDNDTLARIERASSLSERNHLYAMAARAAVMKNDPKAREFADKIEDAELKKSVRAFVDFILVSNALEKRDWDKALQLSRSGELSHFQRAWSYTEIAGLLKSSESVRARELISEAITETGRIAVTSLESAQARVAIARRTAEVDQASTWEAVLEAIKSINRAADYDGEQNKVTVRFQSRNNVAMMAVAAPSISLAGLFERLGEEDVYLAADVARNITNESPRAVALLMTARSALEKKAVNNKRQ